MRSENKKREGTPPSQAALKFERTSGAGHDPRYVLTIGGKVVGSDLSLEQVMERIAESEGTTDVEAP